MRKKIIITRWLYVLIQGLLGYSAWQLLLHANASHVFLLFFSSAYNSLPIVIQFGIIVSCGFSLPWFLRKHRVYHTSHTIKNDLIHPPIYLAAFAACGYTLATNNILRESLEPVILLQFLLGTMASFLYMRSTQTKTEKNNTTEQEKFDLKVWLEEEIPIKNRNYDLLGINSYAERIERLLSQPLVATPKSHQIAIRGDFGTGKSSLCKIIKNDLQGKGHFLFCYVDGWGRENISFAGQIIEIIIDKLSEEIDASALTLLPENYVNSLNGTGIGSVVAITHLLNPTRKENPEIYLQQLDQLLATIKRKMVIIIEDFDRGPEPEKTINELASLMERLKELENINFILCLKGDKSTVLDKVCNHIEDILPISYESIQRITHEFIGLIEDECTGKIHYPPKRNEYVFIETISPLIKTPRNFKKILRRTYSAWKSLQGEVYFYDLFHLNILRFSNIESFSFLTKNLDTLRNLKELGATEKSITKSTTQLAITEEEKNAIIATTLTFFIGPYFGDTETVLDIKASLTNYKRLISNSENVIQRACHNPIYMRNAITENLEKDSPSDREILPAIHSELPSKSVIDKLESIENENHYTAQMKRVVEWMSLIKTEENYLQLATIIGHEFSRLQTPKTSLYFNFGLKSNFKNHRQNNSKIYILCEVIENFIDEYLRGEIKQHGEKILSEVFKRVILNNSSIALEMIIHCQYMQTKAWMKKEFLNESKKSKNIFDTMDVTHTTFLSDLYSITHENQDIDRSLFRFHKEIFELGLSIEKPFIPTILYHLEKANTTEEYMLEEFWNGDLLKKLILGFEYKSIVGCQYDKELEEILRKWKKKAKNNSPPFHQEEQK